MINSIVYASARAVSRSSTAVVAVASTVRQPGRVFFRDTSTSLREKSPLEALSGTPRRRALSSAVAALDGDDGGAAEAMQKEQQAEGSIKKPRRRRLMRDRPAPITVTDRAAVHLTRLLASKPGKVGVRLGVKRRGCNGMSYTLKYADEKPKGDEEVVVKTVAPQENHVDEGGVGGQGALGSQEGKRLGGSDIAWAVSSDEDNVRLFVDPMATLYIAGTVMDWEETELSSEFTFRNPNAKGECGCGESFNV